MEGKKVERCKADRKKERIGKEKNMMRKGKECDA
jgi:hypothetical protein